MSARGIAHGWPFALSGAGALLYVVSGSRFAIDRVRCANWPDTTTGWLAAAVFALALAAMATGWIALVRDAQAEKPARGGLAGSLVAALAIHLLVLAAPPFLSDDGLAYGAIGALTALHGQDMYAPLGALPADDAYRLLIAQYPAWLAHPSTYGPLANGVDALVVGIAGGDVRLALKLFQLVAALALVGTALLAARAARLWAAVDPGRGEPRALGLAAFRLVALSPLALIEATGNAHNDVFLALFVAAFAVAAARGRPAMAAFALLSSLLVKLSAVLPLAFCALRLVARRIDGPRGMRAALIAGAAALVGLVLVVAAWPLLAETSSTMVRLIAPPDGGTPFCTRSLECAPRWLFHFVLGRPDLAWITGLVFRALGLGLLLALAWRSRRDRDPLPGLAAFLLFYYLFCHAYMQAWYLLSLLPLVVFLSRRLQAVALAFVLSSLAQYGFDFVWACAKAMPWVGVREIGQLVTVLVPPLAVLALAKDKTPPPDAAT